MKNHIRQMASVLCFAALALAPAISSAQNQPMAKAQAIAQQLDLTPQQKAKLLPILADEVPKVQKVKNDNSLSKIQKMEQVRAIHRQTDPQMKAILSPAQYQKLQTIRHQAIREATQGRY
jgi:Spy/CpxP family protein refolding chaperone